VKKYIYFQSPLDVWFELALTLQKKKIAKPILWIDSNKEDSKVKETFDCEIFQFYDQYIVAQKNIPVRELASKFILSDRYHYVKDICLKMMDREDIVGIIRQIDREAIFYYWLIWACDKIEKYEPDFLLMHESPHSYFQYLIYELCKFNSIKVLSFGMITKFAPVLYLRDGIFGEKIRIDQNTYDERIKKILIDSSIQALKSEVNSKNSLNQIIMSYQTNLNAELTGFRGKLKYILKEIIKDILIRVPLNYTQKLFTRSRSAQLLQIENRIFKRLGFSRHKIRSVQEKIWQELEASLIKNSSELDSKEYVFVALHYEPERNSLPDGYVFYEQIKLIMAIRRITPENISILVKEHPSQISRARIGYLGRSSFYYELLSKIEGVKLVSNEVSSRDLIKNAKFTASLGGTMSLETALQEKISIIFGNPWFKGAPNIISYTKDLTIEDITKKKIESYESLIRWVEEFINLYGIPGMQNPSSLRSFKRFSNDKDFWQASVDGMEHVVTKILNNSNYKS
jgi:hypothetical protein